jgi:methylenetetrahydrofolate dehydrogenase (NADP+)/methenyltetrahydrofolate cyclohydrolase
MKKILDGKPLAEELLDKIKIYSTKLVKKPRLAVILVGNNPASEIYVRKKLEACSKVGFESHCEKISENAKTEDVLDVINKFNNCNLTDGILVQLPLPSQIDRDLILKSISVSKDVDCFHPLNVGFLIRGKPNFVPPTVRAICYILNYHGYEVSGKHVVVVNRSDVVGKPLWAAMVNANATVTVCHDHTPPKLLKKICKQAEILVSAVGKPAFITPDMTSRNQVVVDVGISKVEGKIVGDVSGECDVDAVTRVPGLGALTVAFLIDNTIFKKKLDIHTNI